MPDNSYFVWDGSPVLFSTGQLHLSFPVSIIGFILSVILYFYLYSIIEKRVKEKKSRKERKTESIKLPGTWIIGMIIGSLIVGQLVALPLGLWVVRTLGPVTIRWYGVLFALAFLVGYYLGTRMYRDAGQPIERLEALLTYIMIATIVGARLGHVLFYEPDYYFTHPTEIIKIWHGGLASHGAAIGMIIAIWLYTRKYRDLSFIWVCDRVVIPVAIGGAFVRIGNFFNSEILGHVSHVPWAIIFERHDMLPRHPSMLYESLCYFIGFIILWGIYRKYKGSPPEGLLFGVFLVYVFTGRFLIEFTKLPQADFTQGWPISMGQILSIPFVLLGIWILAKKVHYSKKGPPEKLNAISSDNG